MSLLDIMVAKGYIGTRESLEGQETANGTAVLERGKKKATWRKAWAVHVDFSNVIPEVCDIDYVSWFAPSEFAITLLSRRYI
jgi:hypothetical protein